MSSEALDNKKAVAGSLKLGDGQGKSKVRILAVDDNIQNVELLEGLLASRGYEVIKAYNGMEALKKLEETNVDMVLLDVLMPKMDGYETCRRIKSRPDTRLLPVIMLTALDSIEDKIKGIEAGADDFITKPFQKPELLARVKSFERLKGLLDELENAQNVLFSLASALDYNDPYTHGHSRRVSEFSVRLAAHIGLDHGDQDIIRNAGVLHDIGKIATDKGILHKPGALNAIEYKHVKDHPVVGEQICKPLKFARPLLPIIRHHHEKFNGTGYPDGLVGEDIPLGARIMAIVDVYDALTSVRPYRSDIPPEVALEVMKAEAIKGYWDKELLDAFCEILAKDGYTIDVLSTGPMEK